MKYCVILFIILTTSCHNSKNTSNGSFEEIESNLNTPSQWILSYSDDQKLAYKVGLDSNDKENGKYSISIEKISNSYPFGIVDYRLPANYKGNTIQLKGYIKTKDVSEGYAGLWLKTVENGRVIAVDNMKNVDIHGTNEWKQYAINLPYNPEASEIHFGGLLIGNGKAWFDHFELLIDGLPIKHASTKQLSKAEKDTTFNKNSGISGIHINPQVINNLALTCQYWSFIKYHHAAVNNGEYNWDAELFRLLTKVTRAKSIVELSKYLEDHLNTFPVPAKRNLNSQPNKRATVILPDYGELFKHSLSKTLTKKLIYIRENRSMGQNYFIGTEGAGNPKFRNEKAYESIRIPDQGFRLLALFRYWAIINYYYPYRNEIGEDWNLVLKDMIPVFLGANNEKKYLIAILKLIARVNDTHGNIWSPNSTLDSLKGQHITPFEAKFINGKLIVTNFYSDTLNMQKSVKIGDEILKINHTPVRNLITDYLPIVPASNYATKLRDLPRNHLLRSNESHLTLEIRRDKKTHQFSIPLIDWKIPYQRDENQLVKDRHLINKNIGYIFAGKYQNKNLTSIINEFDKTIGIIIDMRSYPSDFMPFTIGNYIKPYQSPFAKVSKFDISQPGAFLADQVISNGGSITSRTYKGRIIVLVDANTQSQSEYTTMAFQSAKGVTVIGTQTAGADGDISSFFLPGGISTSISGNGIYYPDGSATQGVGVKINFVVKPTVQGIIDRKDEILEKAIELIRQK